MQIKIREYLQKAATVGHKKIMICLFTIIGVCSFSSLMAQMPRDTAEMRKRMEERFQQMKSDLKLTDVQADSISSIQREFQGKMQAMRMDPSNSNLSREDRMAKMKPLNDAREARLKAALGPDVFAKYQSWQEEHRMQRGGGGGRNNN